MSIVNSLHADKPIIIDTILEGTSNNLKRKFLLLQII